MRHPLVAGQFYEADFERLNKQIKNCFLNKYGPADLPVKKRKGKLLGVISPHAGYEYSGQCAAWAYKKIAESNFIDTFIILGPSHIGSLDISIATEDFQTPFGAIKINKEITSELLKYSFIKEDNEIHRTEHSIEVQLPFLQFVNREYIKKLRIVPIIIGTYNQKLAEAITDLEKEFIVIASSDFTHYGSDYNYTPFVFNKKENMYALDKEIIETIKKLNAEEFLKFTKNKTVCGRLPIATMMDIARWNKIKPDLLQYYTSGDISQDYNNAVGYAAMSFKNN